MTYNTKSSLTVGLLTQLSPNSMSSPTSKLADNFLTRRELLKQCGMGMGALGLAQMLGQTVFGENPQSAIHNPQSGNPLAPRKPPLPAKAKRVIHLFMNGGPSAMDSFDPKPMLTKYDGKALPFTLKTERKTGWAWGSPFQFKKYGQSGLDVSELFPHLAECADDLCVIRSMTTDLPNHGPSFLMMNCGDARQVRPSLGSWATYGLGSENQNLPGYIAMCPDGFPSSGAANWRAGFLPGAYQGTYIDTRETEVEKLIEFIRNEGSSQPEQRKQLDLLAALNRRFQQPRAEDAVIDAQIQSFELAYRMQMEAADAFNISKEPESMRKLYGETVHGRQALIARRLLERGVRFIQLWHGEGQPWDSHDHLERDHRKLALASDQPVAALLKDLKQRGMLDDTLVIWGGEFGRTPTVEVGGGLAGKPRERYGRDHNPYGFTMWMAGGGVKAGHTHGATDEFGFKAVEKPMHVHDLHATILHLLGFDHETFTYRYAGRDFRLTDVHGQVIKELLA